MGSTIVSPGPRHFHLKRYSDIEQEVKENHATIGKQIYCFLAEKLLSEEGGRWHVKKFQR